MKTESSLGTDHLSFYIVCDKSCKIANQWHKKPPVAAWNAAPRARWPSWLSGGWGKRS